MSSNWKIISDSNWDTKKYTCSFCGSVVSSNTHSFLSYVGSYDLNWPHYEVWICPHCHRPTIFIKEKFECDEQQIPSVKFGEDVKHLNKQIDNIYNEMRECYKVGAYNAVAMLSRALLLFICTNLCKDNSINESSKFVDCVNYLVNNGYVPINAKSWVDKLRSFANSFTHKSINVGSDQAKDLIKYMQMILKIVYEFAYDHDNEDLELVEIN